MGGSIRARARGLGLGLGLGLEVPLPALLYRGAEVGRGHVLERSHLVRVRVRVRARARVRVSRLALERSPLA